METFKYTLCSVCERQVFAVSNSNLSEEEKLRHMLMKKLLRSMSRGGVMADVIEIKNENEFDEYLNKSRNKGKLVIADFWAPWCPPCIVMAPVFKEVAKEFKGKAFFLRVNVDRVTTLAERYGITSIPTLIAFCKGNPIDIRIGFMPKPALSAWVKRLIEQCS